MVSRRSRLYKKLENKSRKTLLFNTLGIIVITILLIKFGIPLITNLTLLISGVGNSDENFVKEKSVSFIPSPILNPLPIATNSAKIKVTGEAMENQTISLYVNNILENQAKTDEDGSFSFDIVLSEEENSIKVKVAEGDNESDFSESLKISYKSSSPALNIENPADGQSFSKEEKTAKIKGQTDPRSKVIVNGFRAVIDQYNNFSYNLPLKEGENEIKIIAYDDAGNKTEKTLKVTYSP